MQGSCFTAAPPPWKSSLFTREILSLPVKTWVRGQVFTEIDRAEWFGVEEAMQKINEAQGAWIEELHAHLPTAPGYKGEAGG